MNSFSIWSKNYNKNDSLDICLHINFWNLKKEKKSCAYYIDFGIMVNDITKVESVYLFCPFKISEDCFEDLGEKISKDVKLLNAIFNENYSIKNFENEKFHDIIDSNNKSTFILYSIGQDERTIKEKYNGTILEFKINKFDRFEENKKYYIRFRLCTQKLNDIIYHYNNSNIFFENAYWITELFDFRMNEKRNLEPQLLKDMELISNLKILKTHLLIMKSSNDVLTFVSSQNEISRILENDLWSNYIDFSHLDKKMISYHWKLPGDDSFNVITKSKQRKFNWKTNLFYLLCFIILTLGLDLLSYSLTKLFFEK